MTRIMKDMSRGSGHVMWLWTCHVATVLGLACQTALNGCQAEIPILSATVQTLAAIASMALALSPDRLGATSCLQCECMLALRTRSNHGW